jgi:hypothetical protein
MGRRRTVGRWGFQVNPKPQAKVLRLLRFDAGRWWYWQTLRAQGQTAKAIELERASIRASVRHIRENIGRQAITHRADCIEFTDRLEASGEGYRPFVGFVSCVLPPSYHDSAVQRRIQACCRYLP